MVHGLAAQLNGGLTIKSKPGEGTAIELWLPVSAAEPFKAANANGGGCASNPVGKVLLVDDEDLVRMSTADMLLDMGYEVREANSAREAMRLVDEGLHPDILVSDHLMPGMTGLELATRLRSRWPDLPVLIVSGYPESDPLLLDYPRFTKPFRLAELVESVTSLLPAGTSRDD